MILASSDPMNISLVIGWNVLLLCCQALAWYAYYRWKHHPDDSLSHNIALGVRAIPLPAVAAIFMCVGLVLGVIFGMFLGHWTWPVELS